MFFIWQTRKWGAKFNGKVLSELICSSLLRKCNFDTVDITKCMNTMLSPYWPPSLGTAFWRYSVNMYFVNSASIFKIVPYLLPYHFESFAEKPISCAALTLITVGSKRSWPAYWPSASQSRGRSTLHQRAHTVIIAGGGERDARTRSVYFGYVRLCNDVSMRMSGWAVCATPPT
jgi:hypothetical protein